MNYIDIDFPDELSNFFSGGAEFSTSYSTLKNKQEVRNQNWQSPRYKYNLIYKNCSEKNYQTLQSFFLICGGKKTAFNFLDKNDNKILKQPIKCYKNDIKKYEIYKLYSYQNISFKRDIYKTKNEKIYINNQLIDDNKYIIEDNILSFNDNVNINENDVVSIDCNFYTIVRFDNDFLPVIRINNTIELPDISLIEVKK